jgi:hypothetical protein
MVRNECAPESAGDTAAAESNATAPASESHALGTGS